MMLPQFFNLPGLCIAYINKVGSASTARAIIKAYPAAINPMYPDYEATITDPLAQYPIGKNADNTQWQNMIPSTTAPTKPVFMLVRDPVQRFLSSMARIQIEDIDGTITALNGGTTVMNISGYNIMPDNNWHFYKQVNFTKSGQPTKMYRFPDQLAQFCADTGLAMPFPLINAATNPKPTLTTAQTTALQAYYADDVALFNGIAS